MESYDLQTRYVTVLLVPPTTAGDASSQTIVTFTNYKAPPGQLKVCKIAGAGVAVNTPFTFMVDAGTGFPVEAGPLDQGGYCAVVPGKFQVGTPETVTETVPAGYAAPSITVDGASTPSADCQPIPGCVVAEIGPGINEVSFTNKVLGQSQNMETPFTNLDIVNYSLVRQIAVTGTQSYMTYRADLLNMGTTTMGPITASLTSLDPSSARVMGQGALNFASAPANSEAASSSTFTVQPCHSARSLKAELDIPVHAKHLAGALEAAVSDHDLAGTARSRPDARQWRSADYSPGETRPSKGEERMTSQIAEDVKRPCRDVSRNGHFRFNLAFAAAMQFLLGVGLPSGAWAKPILYIVTQNNVTGTNPTSDTNTLMSVDLGAARVGGIFTATAIGPTTLQGSGGQTAEIRGLAYVKATV